MERTSKMNGKKQNIFKAVATFAVALTVIMPVSSIVAGNRKNMDIRKTIGDQDDEGIEYWALLFAVGVYYNHPEKDRPSMLVSVNNLYDVLIDSHQWQPDHVHMITGSNATGMSLIKELMWLIKNADSNDMVFIYLTTHGSPLMNNGIPVDIPPKDEADGADEILVMYDGFDNPYAFVWDDLLNFFLMLLRSQGVCLIVDSCFSGGFNDYWLGKTRVYTAGLFTNGLAEELGGQNRVVLMSCEENTSSYGSYFSDYLIEGLSGKADIYGNGDGVNSAEEAFYYAQHQIDLMGIQHPTILDCYHGEFPVT